MSEVRVSALRCDASGGNSGSLKSWRGICAAVGTESPWAATSADAAGVASAIISSRRDFRDMGDRVKVKRERKGKEEEREERVFGYWGIGDIYRFTRWLDDVRGIDIRGGERRRKREKKSKRIMRRRYKVNQNKSMRGEQEYVE